MEAASTSETLVSSYQTTQRYNPEDSHLQKFISLKNFNPFQRCLKFKQISLAMSQGNYLEKK
jgi:hypothetical protein